MLYNFGVEFEQLEMQKSIESLTAPVIDKKYIRKEATGTLKLLFDCITVNYWLTKDEVWREMGEEVIQLTIDS